MRLRVGKAGTARAVAGAAGRKPRMERRGIERGELAGEGGGAFGALGSLPEGELIGVDGDGRAFEAEGLFVADKLLLDAGRDGHAPGVGEVLEHETAGLIGADTAAMELGAGEWVEGGGHGHELRAEKAGENGGECRAGLIGAAGLAATTGGDHRQAGATMGKNAE